MTYFNLLKASALATLFALCFGAPVSAGVLPAIETFTLANGMQVVLAENHRVAAVTHMLWYKVGAADDFPGRSGLAHYNEHMMFQGTEKIPAGQFAARVSGWGGVTNASTSRDYTVYYVSIAKEYLAQVMEMEADRMLNLSPTAENFAKERQVIIEERRMSIDNRPEALLAEAVQATLWRNHPYHTPTIGWMHEMEALSREDVLAFHAQFYCPANATLVVAGDITRAELETLARKYYGALPAGKPYTRHWRVEPPQNAGRLVDFQSTNVRQPQFVRYYAAPSVNSAQARQVIPLFVLAQILGGGSTSRLYQSLVVTQKLATSIDVDYNGIAVGDGEFHIYASPAQGISMNTLAAAIDKELAIVTKQPVSGDELTRAKTLLKAETIFARDGLEGMARLLGVLLMAGLPTDYFNQWPSLIENAKAEEVQSAAASVFDPRASVTGYLTTQAGRP